MDTTDEMCWGGVWMYLATKDQKYLTTAESFYTPGAAWGQSWDEKIAGAMVCILLLKIRNISPAESFYTPGAAWGQSWDEKIAGAMVSK